jgi:hypothetical protein
MKRKSRKVKKRKRGISGLGKDEKELGIGVEGRGVGRENGIGRLEGRRKGGEGMMTSLIDWEMEGKRRRQEI